MTKDNRLLGKFELTGIPAAPRGVPQIEVTFEIDVNGIMNVQAKDKGSGSTKDITISRDKASLTQEEIDAMVQAAEEMAEEDKLMKEKVEARNKLENYVYSVRNTVKDDKKGGKLSEEDKQAVTDGVNAAIEWIESNPDAEKQEYDDKYHELEQIVQPIFSKLYGAGAGGAGGEGGADEEMPQHEEL